MIEIIIIFVKYTCPACPGNGNRAAKPNFTISGEPFEKYIKKQFTVLGLNNTYLDQAEQIIYNRSRNYVRDKHHRLKNAPYVDNSYKWAGGGFLSTVGDLVKFGNAMLYSHQQRTVVSSPVPSPQKKPAVSSSDSSQQKDSSSSQPTKLPEKDQSSAATSLPSTSNDAETEEVKVKSDVVKAVSLDASPSPCSDAPEEISDNSAAGGGTEAAEAVENVVYQPGPLASVNSRWKSSKATNFLTCRPAHALTKPFSK